MPAVSGPAATRLRVDFRGAVQGVGFRPFLYRLATELDLTGWVRNGPAGVTCEVEGPAEAVRRSCSAFHTNCRRAPPSTGWSPRFSTREARSGASALIRPS